MTNYCMILTTASSQEEADKITEALLKARLASCVQQLPIKSAYHWKGKIEKSAEILLQIKTQEKLYDKVEDLIRVTHSYETPQIIKIGITGGLPAYLDWIATETK